MAVVGGITLLALLIGTAACARRRGQGAAKQAAGTANSASTFYAEATLSRAAPDVPSHTSMVDHGPVDEAASERKSLSDYV